MSDSKVKISNILESQLPEFILDDNPLFKEFLEQYYLSQEHEYGTIDLAENIADLKNIDSFVKLKFTQTTPKLTKFVSNLASTIEVDNHLGFLPKNGIVKVNNEIFTYTGKTSYAQKVTGFNSLDNTIQLSSCTGLNSFENQSIIFDKSFSSVVAGQVYYVTEVKNTTTITISDETDILNNVYSLTDTNPLDATALPTATHFAFTGCIRGFSGIDKISGNGNSEFLKFNNTNTSFHAKGSSVTNLSLVFLAEFFKKYKKIFLPGIEDRKFESVNIDNILSRARDFYSSKGTDTSLKILFSVLFGKFVEILKPFDSTIQASTADFQLSDIIVAESISGNASKLQETTLLQGSVTNPTAKGVVGRRQDVFLGNKKYHKIFFSRNSIENSFKVSKKTRVLGVGVTDTTLTVDSTIGFPESGSFFNNENGDYVEVTYSGKSANQFFNCVGLSTTLIEGDIILDDNFVYGYEDNDMDKLVTMRVVGTVVGLAENANTTSQFRKNDLISVKHLGEKIDEDDVRFNKWFYNNVTYMNVENTPSSTLIQTQGNHYLNVEDNVDILLESDNSVVESNRLVSSVNSRTEFQINSGSLLPDQKYIVRKRLDFANSNLNSEGVLSNIQNTFVDNDKNTYVAFSGYPGYNDVSITDRSKEFPSTEINVIDNTITIPDHNFKDGERLYYQLISGTSGISTGNYYASKVNSNTIKLASSLASLNNGVYFNISGISTISSTHIHKLTPSSLFEQDLVNQNNFKRIYKNPKPATEHKDIVGPVGVSVNGIELYSPVGEDSIFYGQIDAINILNNGSDYDIINPPKVSVDDSNGTDAVLYGQFTGKIEDVILTNAGFNYENTPTVTISGGNGTEALAEARMRGFTYSKSFNEFAINVADNKINISDHRFVNGEEVVYSCTGTPIGIGSTAVGFGTDRLTIDAVYFLSTIGSTELTLHTSEENALAGIGTIDFTNDGTLQHSFRSNKIRKIIDRIVISNSTDDFSNKKVVVDAVSWPPTNQKNLYSSFVGVNIEDNYIYARNHTFKSGDNVEYSFDGTAIAGLSTGVNYKVTVLDADRFYLSEAGTASSISSVNYERKLYENLTSVGVGTHTFQYPSINVEINGLVSIGDTTVTPAYYNATAIPVVRGKLDNVFIRNGGVGYGVTNLINYQKDTNVKIETGKDADIKPIVSNGQITSIYIANSGSEYTTPPTVNVIGQGRLAKLVANIVDGSITSIDIIDPGTGYTKDTTIEVIPTGSGGKLNAEIHEWKLDNVKRYSHVLAIENNRDLVKIKSNLTEKQSKVVSFYAGKKLRTLLNDNLEVNGDEKTTGLNHSPIIGWAYDGNPIYGPYGNGFAIFTDGNTGGKKKLRSSYALDKETSTLLRPPTEEPPTEGFFTQDYVYKANGDLDEYNGRFCITPEFPNGTYAYFSTLDASDSVSYPYITKSHYNETDAFNYNAFIDQNDSTLNDGSYKRNVTHLGVRDSFRRYPFLNDPLNSTPQLSVSEVKSNRIDSVIPTNSGSDYRVGEQVNLNELSIDTEIDEIVGRNISNITTSDIVLENTIFSVENDVVTGITTIPHDFSNNDIVEISGISSALYKNIEGFKKIELNSVNSSVSVAIANTTVTGFTTDIQLSDSTFTGKFQRNEILKIGNELMQIVAIDAANNRYRVTRAVNGSSASGHAAGTAVIKQLQRFTFDIDKKLENNNISFNSTENFAVSAVGIGSTYTSVVVGTSGGANITVSIPPRAIYIRNHRFNTGDKLSLVSVGGTINASATASLTNAFDISSVDLFAVNVGTDFIGLATSKAGVASSSIFFVNSSTGTNHTLSQTKPNLTGIVKKVSANVVLDEAHNLSLGDEVRFNVIPSKTQTSILKYNQTLKKLVVNPKSFVPAGIATGTTSEITIENHGLETGDVVIYTNAVGVATPLQNNRQYHVIKITDDRLRLAESDFNSKVFPYQNITITEQGSGTHEISKVNPRLNVLNGGKLELDVKDTSLDNFDINFYIDEEFNSRYESKLIKKPVDVNGNSIIGNNDPNTKIVLDINNDLLKEFYYRLEGDDSNFTDTHPSSVDENVSEYSKISIVDSKFNQNYTITSIASTEFGFTLVGSAETTSYTSAGFSTATYSTNSKTEIGGIHSVKIVNPGINIKTAPIVVSVGTTLGKGAEFKVASTEIGEIVDTSVDDQGIEYLEDKTLKPKANSNIVLKLINTRTLNSIGIVTSGIDYITPPSIVAIGNSTIVTSSTLQGGSVETVDIIVNDSNLKEDLRIVPTNNSNGVSIINAVSNSQVNTLSLKAPVNGFVTFPFEIGDEIYVENVQITNNADGYNSSDYGFRTFIISARNTVSGTESISYSIAGIGSTGGNYNLAQNAQFGRVIKNNHLAAFTPEFRNVRFTEGEKVIDINDPSIFGIVAKNGWDEITNTLRISDVNGEFTESSVIRGNVGNFKATISEVEKFDFDLEVGSTSQDSGIWANNIGRLNDDLQRIHDNDYYQRFSYSIRGEIALEKWKESVDSLDHTAGYKNFSDYQIINTPAEKVNMSPPDTEINFNVEIVSDASVQTRMSYDLASEDTDAPNLSKLIIFDSKVITDYNESRTNKVLMIDDISPQFTGVTTSVGGGIVGLSTFAILNGGNPLLHNTFNPATGISTESVFTINDHNFNTGERLLYDPTNAGINTGSSIGIVTDSAPGVASTDLMPSFVYAIRTSEDTFKLAISEANALAGAGIAMTITNSTGIGLTQSLSVETELASSRSIITIDNVIQSPLARKDVIVGLASSVGIGSTQISVTDVSNIAGKSIIKIEDEILKVDLVGIGATNILNVQRGAMGTVAAAHTVGAATTIASGDYRINQGKIYFSDPPYGPAGIGNLTTNSTFSGRIYYRLEYDTNVIMDDVSEEFDGTQKQFNILRNGIGVTGITTNFGAVLINNIFQKPFFGDVGSIQESDYRVIKTGSGEDIQFTGEEANKDLPRGGMINEFAVGVGSNYQVPTRAIGAAVVNGSGVITGVTVGVGTTGVRSGGAGHLFPPNVSIADTLGGGSGAAVTATVGAAGTITGFTVVSGGTGYSQAAPPLVFTDEPGPYKNLTLVGGSGTDAKMDVVVGTGGSIIKFNMSNRGIGYEVGDELFLTGLPFNPVGVGSTDFSITVRNKYQDKFAGWAFGQLLELDDFSNQFNGARKTFLITRTKVTTEYYSLVAQPNSGIILQNNFLVFLNDVLQRPGIDYVFTSGTRFTFNEAPKAGSKFKIYFYAGSSLDYQEIDVEETVKPGDRLRLQRQDFTPSQSERTIYELIAADTVETETYGGVGIVTDSSFLRPVEWTKQTSDLIIDGQVISKERSYLEPLYFPSTNVIAPVSSTDTEIYVEDCWTFSQVDDLAQIQNNIRIVGLGTTAVVEKIQSVTYDGDFGNVTAIGASALGIGTNTPKIEFTIFPDPRIYSATVANGKVQNPGISVGDYFVIRNTTLGAGVTSIDGDVNNVVAVSTSFVDNVYRAAKVEPAGIASGIVVSANIESLTGINTLTQPTDLATYGTYSWGKINTGTRPVGTAKSFTFHNTNGIAGINTSAHVSRLSQLRVSY